MHKHRPNPLLLYHAIYRGKNRYHIPPLARGVLLRNVLENGRCQKGVVFFLGKVIVKKNAGRCKTKIYVLVEGGALSCGARGRARGLDERACARGDGAS
jgi:hypothetical protein